MALSDLLTPSYVEVGKVKIGTLGDARSSQSGSTWRPPVKLDHFIITTLYRDQNGLLTVDADLMTALKEHADPKDGKLRSIPVMFGSNDLDQVMQTNYVWYVGKRLAGRSDGREVEFWFDPETGKELQESKVYKWHESWLEKVDPTYKPRNGSTKPLFKLYTALNVMIASPAARFGGFYRFRTTSEISARQLYGSLLHLRRLTGGTLRGLVFRLVVRPMVVTPNGQTTTVHVVHVEYVNSDLKQLQSAAREQTAFELANAQAVVETEKQYKMLLAAGREDEPDEELEEEVPALPPKQPTPAEREAAACDEIEKSLAAAQDLDAVKTFGSGDRFKKDLWPQLGKDQQAAAVQLKDKRKAELAKPVEAPPPVEESGSAEGPPPDEAPPKSTAKAGKAIIADIEKLCVEKAGSWADFRMKHNIAATRVKDLTADEALKVHAMLNGESAGAA